MGVLTPHGGEGGWGGDIDVVGWFSWRRGGEVIACLSFARDNTAAITKRLKWGEDKNCQHNNKLGH